MSSFLIENPSTYIARVEVLRQVCGELPLGDVVEVEDEEEDEDDSADDAVRAEDDRRTCAQITKLSNHFALY